MNKEQALSGAGGEGLRRYVEAMQNYDPSVVNGWTPSQWRWLEQSLSEPKTVGELMDENGTPTTYATLSEFLSLREEVEATRKQLIELGKRLNGCSGASVQ